MAQSIEDYALIGDCRTAGLVGRDGSIDWLCLPRFDSDAVFAALLGDGDNGFWKIAPVAPVRRVQRRYREGTLTLETEMETEDGTIVLVDFMPLHDPRADVVRIVLGKSGAVRVRSELVLRCGYGRIVPWVRHAEGGIQAIAGPDRFRFSAPVETRGHGLRTHAELTISAGDRAPFVLAWSPSHERLPPVIDAKRALETTDRTWHEWITRCERASPFDPHVRRSLVTLKALSYAPTGGMVAAPTSSLPEAVGSVRNWDYRYCWVRDATFTLTALLNAGFKEEARAWEQWLLRATAGSPSQMQILYGIAGERRLPEIELGWLDGFEGSRPVRIGNAAADQLQLDVYGELMDTMHLARETGLEASDAGWKLQMELLDHLATGWREADQGIWEVRGPARHFTHSKVMCWVAFDRAVKAVEHFGREGPVDRWRAVRDEIHDEICRRAHDPDRNTFVQYFGGTDLDAALLLLPVVGFLPASDRRVAGTLAAVQRELMEDGLVKRYLTRPEIEGLPEGEGTFLPCSFWLADALVLAGRYDEARAVFDRLLGLTNDVGLLAEEYDPRARRMLGNLPQALSHVALVNTALNLSRKRGPAHLRGGL